MSDITQEKLLVVDDEAQIRKLLKRIFEQEGYICTAVESVQAAREALMEDTYDFLITDISMPAESGVEILRYAKEKFPQMGRIVISAKSEKELVEEILTVGVYGYILKPISKDAVLITLANARKHQLLDQHMRACVEEMSSEILQRNRDLDSLVSNIDLGVILVNKDREIIESNRFMKTYFPQLTGTQTFTCCDVIKKTKVNTDEENRCLLEQSLQDGQKRENQAFLESALGNKFFRIVTCPIIDEKGRVVSAIGLYEDQTEQRELEQELLNAQKFEAVGNLAAGIAHEVNTPIQFVGDNLIFIKESFEDITELLDKYEAVLAQVKKDGSLDDKLVEDLEERKEDIDLEYLLEELPQTFDQSEDGVKRVSKIVKAMKDFSHPGEEELKPCDINKMLDSTLTISKNSWKYVAELDLDYQQDLPMAPCFSGELSQAFLNVIVNAAHAIEDVTEGGVKGMGKIAIRSYHDNDHVIIKIKDSGGGIPEHVKDNIFNHFFTTKERGRGTGQGLSIAKRVVEELHKGSLSFETEQGVGTEFTFCLPVTEP
ncbi:MAG: response regulator [Desulfobulbaceae bacterium]|nr:MAG: response regulator [Desulfobulbaceae bacterium]